eukprot:COSAG06_NODE_41649_length_389_cov_0.813793_1_plen_51_part_01
MSEIKTAWCFWSTFHFQKKPFYTKTMSFYQDRLGTNIEKPQKDPFKKTRLP